MYVGRKHSVTATAKEVLPFACKSCGHQARALVVGVGQGEGNSPYFLDEQGAKGRAASSAERSAHENAALTLTLARCPRCNKVDEGAYAALKGKWIAIALLVSIGFPVFGVVLDAMQSTSFGVWIFGPLGVFCAWVIWAKSSWKWKTVDRRVAFVRDVDAADVEKDMRGAPSPR